VDFIIKLPLVAGKNRILVVCDKLFKMTYFVARTKEMLAKELIWLLIKKLNKMLGIETKLATLFYSQTNSQIERVNQKLKQYLWFFVNYKQKN